MLATFRAHAKGWIAWVFVILVTVPFAFWGLSQYRSLVTTSYVAKVNGQKIMPQDFQQAYQQAYEQRQQTLGNKFNPSPKQQAELKQQTLNQLIQRTLLQQQATKDHLVASKDAVRAQIQQIPAFQANGHFSFQRYQSVLSSNGMSVGQFEAQVRSDIVLQQIQDGIASSAFPIPGEVDTIAGLLKQQRRIAWFVLPLDHFKQQAAPDEHAIKNFYNAHQAQFSTPTTVEISYVQLSQKTLEDRVKVTNAALQDYYDSHENRYGVPPARKVAEILIKPKSESAKDWAAAREKAQKLRAQVQASDTPLKTFAALARKDSDDPVSRRNGGSLGYIARGQMSKTFSDTLFGIKKTGQTAKPVRLKDGWAVLQLLGERSGSVKPFSQVRDQVAKDYKASQAKNRYYTLGDKLANLAYEHAGSLKPVASALNLQIRSISGVTRDKGTGIAAKEAVRKAAFSASVLKQHQNSAPIKLGPQDAVVLRVANVSPSHLRPLAQVRDQIVAALQHQAQVSAAREAASNALKALRSGNTLQAVAKSMHAKLQGPKQVSRGASGLPPAVETAVFSMPPSADGAASYGTTSLAKGGEAVYSLMAVKSMKASALPDAERKAYAAQIGQIYASQDVQDYLAWLHANADIKIIKKNIP